MPNPSSTREDRLLEQLRPHLRALPSAAADDELLIEQLARAKLALLGEASHGTHEFYAERAWLTQRLTRDHGFNAVIVEADWPDAWRVNRYIRHRSDDRDAEEALSGFERFPTWMWRNTVVRDFVEWLREYNHGRPVSQQVGFYGMDLYSLYSSVQSVLEYLGRVDPEAAARARSRYACFDHFGEDTQAYGYAASFGMKSSCEDEVVQQLREMNRRVMEMLAASKEDRADLFFAQQNARLVRNAEEYYRTMFHGRVSSWNLRDSHMVDTLQALDRHLGAHGPAPRIAVWAHNSHLGDASATEMGEIGEWNVGQLIRENWEWVSGQEYGWETILVGNDAPYSRRLQTHAHAAIRRTTDNQYFYRFSSIRNEDGEPKSYADLVECQQSCMEELKIRQVDDALDGKYNYTSV